MTTPVSGTSAAAPATAAPAPTNASSLDQNAFMKMLVASIKYQDPSKPADGQQYMAQMATFAQVEKLGQLVTAQNESTSWQKRLSADGMVGKQIAGTTAVADGATPISGVVTGVRYDASGPVLELAGGKTLAADLVYSVSQPAAATPTTTPSTTTSATTSPTA